MSSPDLELVHLVKRYGATTAGRPASTCSIAGGRYCCLLGPSGCGKTIDAAHDRRPRGGQRRATSCSAARNITDLPAAERGTAMMFQSYALFPHLSALDNVAFSLKMRGVDKAERHAARDGAARARVARPRWRTASRPSSRAASSSAWRWRAR